MKRAVSLAALAAMAFGSSGCATYGYGYGGGWHHHRYHSGARGAGAAIELFAAVASLAMSASESSRESEPVTLVEDSSEYEYAPNPPPVVQVPIGPLPPPRVTAADPTHVSFDASAANAALHAIDTKGCSESAPLTYGHARVTFGKDGYATHVAVDAPAGLSKEAADCLGFRLGKATVPAFEGAPVTVGTTFAIR